MGEASLRPMNRYYPPEWDPVDVPKLKHFKKNLVDKRFIMRVMTPCNMRCDNCGGYIYKAKKCSARTEKVIGEQYLNIPLWRFYMYCHHCANQIIWKTDPQNDDYVLERGATRIFDAYLKAQDQDEKEAKKREELMKEDPMLALEHRTHSMKRQMQLDETITSLQVLNSEKLTKEKLVELHLRCQEELDKLEQDEDDKEASEAFSQKKDLPIKRIEDSDEDEDNKTEEDSTSSCRNSKASAMLISNTKNVIRNEEFVTVQKMLKQSTLRMFGPCTIARKSEHSRQPNRPNVISSKVKKKPHLQLKDFLANETLPTPTSIVVTAPKTLILADYSDDSDE